MPESTLFSVLSVKPRYAKNLIYYYYTDRDYGHFCDSVFSRVNEYALQIKMQRMWYVIVCYYFKKNEEA